MLITSAATRPASIFRYQIERCPDAATIYVGGLHCAEEDVGHLQELVSQLPHTIRTLRIDMHAMDGVPLEILMALRNVLSEWRERRRGNVRLMFARPSAFPVRDPALRGGAGSA